MFKITVRTMEDVTETLNVLVADIDEAWDPELAFRACNRVCDLADDLIALEHDWQQELRRQLDAKAVPSFSVGGTVTVTTRGGTVMSWRCESIGWSAVAS